MLRHFPDVDLEISDSVARVTLNRPEKKNALGVNIHESMGQVLDAILDDESVKVFLITGAGGTFCAGFDLEEVFLAHAPDPDSFYRLVYRTACAWLIRFKSMPVVTVAKVRGYAFGGGYELAALCDIAVTADDAVFGLSEINFGTIPSGGATWSNAHNLARKQALYYALTGRQMTGREAEARGLVTRSVPGEELDAYTESIIDDLVNKDLRTLRSTKQAYEAALRLNFGDSVEMELAKARELAYFTASAWTRVALQQFKNREFRPGLESYKLDATE